MSDRKLKELAEAAQDFLELLDVAVAKPYTVAEIWRDRRLKDKHRELNALIGYVLADQPAATGTARRVVTAAIEWRECDEAEPIGSRLPDEKLRRLAFAVDELRGGQPAATETGVLSAEDYEAFQQLLNAPPEVIPALAEAMRKRRQRCAETADRGTPTYPSYCKMTGHVFPCGCATCDALSAKGHR
jgi:hypothetical protein